MTSKRLKDKLTLSVEEAAAMLGISRNLGYKLARQGKLPGAFQMGDKRLLVSKGVITRLIEGGE